MSKFTDVLDRIENIRLSSIDVNVRGQRQKMNIVNFEEWYDTRVILLNEVLTKLTSILYKTKTDVGFMNIDNVTGRILIPLPWGSNGYKDWGLKSNEACVFKRVMLVRSEMKKPPPLYDYNSELKSWFINHQVYPNGDYGMHYIKMHPITMKEFSKHYEAYKSYTRERTEVHERKRASKSKLT